MPMSNVKAIREYFDDGSSSPVTMQELKDLPKSEREELGELARAELAKNAEDS